MLLLSVSTKKRKHNWEITKRDLTKLTSPSVRTKNDWSRRASGQKIGYLNSRTLRSVRLFFFSLTGRIEPVAPEGISLPSLFQCSQRLKSTKEALSRFFEAAPANAHDHAPSRASPPQQFVPLLRGLPSAASAQHILPRRACPHRRTPNGLQLSLRRHTKKRDTHHGGECRVEAGGMLSARDSLTTSSV